MAEQKGRVPSALYKMCILRIVNSARAHETSDLRELPDTILMDIYYQMLVEKKLCVLGSELAELDVFSRLLRFTDTQHRLLTCFQAVIEHGSNVTSELADAYEKRCSRLPRVAVETLSDEPRREDLVKLGLKLGGFLNEAGWYAAAERVLRQCRDLCLAAPQSQRCKILTLECCHRLLNTQSAFCCFPAAAETYALALSLLDMTIEEGVALTSRPAEEAAAKLSSDITAECNAKEKDWCARDAARAVGMEDLLPRLYKEFTSMFFVRCDYSAAYMWSTRALRLLKPETPAKITVEVVRACGKACVVKRRFARAGLLIRQAVAEARRAFGPHHPRYAFALIDYGFYLLNIDSILHSVSVYEEALSVLRTVFGSRSLHVAMAQEDLAYALYVLEYSSGRFYKAKDHAEKAINIIENLVPGDHLLLASAKRVKALILEEIALDTPAGHDINEPSLLEESEALHKAALELSMMAFGEKNVQTAKHYGNLGRLYQSMQKFQDAETMHLKAIAIKEELLGAEDYEVGLSIGHLASLYNYHMHMYCAAEELYFRSISISLKLFGERYSGLEYDYRGLVHVFTQLKDHEQAQFYNQLLHHWHELREQSKTEHQPSIGEEQAIPLEELKEQFFDPNID